MKKMFDNDEIVFLPIPRYFSPLLPYGQVDFILEAIPGISGINHCLEMKKIEISNQQKRFSKCWIPSATYYLIVRRYLHGSED